MSDEVKVKFLAAGIAGLRGAWTELFDMNLVNFNVGDDAGFEPDVNDTTVHGNLTYIGSSSNIKLKFSNEYSSLRISMTIPEDQTGVHVGNIVLFARIEGNIVPVAMLVLPNVVIKQNASSSLIDVGYNYPSTRLVISLTIKYVELGDEDITLNIEVVAPEYANIPTFGSDLEVPSGEENPWTQFIVNDTPVVGGNPVLVTKDLDNNYFASVLSQNLDSPKYGTVGGPNTNERVHWIWGRTYRISNDLYGGQIGGSSYDEIDLRTVGGNTYL